MVLESMLPDFLLLEINTSFVWSLALLIHECLSLTSRWFSSQIPLTKIFPYSYISTTLWFLCGILLFIHLYCLFIYKSLEHKGLLLMSTLPQGSWSWCMMRLYAQQERVLGSMQERIQEQARVWDKRKFIREGVTFHKQRCGLLSNQRMRSRKVY